MRRRPNGLHGWLVSLGDLGVMHPDGYIELMDRAKDIVISGGENISTVEVEQRFEPPAVVDAAVIGSLTTGGERRRPSSFSATGRPPTRAS